MTRRTTSAAPARSDQPSRTARGYRLRDFCQREGISRSTAWNWMRKGVLRASRLQAGTGRAVGLRVAYAEEAWDDDDE